VSSVELLDRPRRGLSVVLVRYDRQKYAGAWQELRAHLQDIAPTASETVIVDNARPELEVTRLEAGVHLIGGDNSHWEFSAFDQGLEWLRSRRRLLDLTLLVTDAFAAYGTGFLTLVDESLLRFCRRQSAVAGWIDSFMERCRLFDTVYESWLRTSYLVLPTAALTKVQPFAWPLIDEQLFDADWRLRWQPDAPLNSNLKRRLEQWLIRSAENGEPLPTADRWHSSFALDATSFPHFKAKVRSIVREHHLSLRLRAAGVGVYDLRVLADRLARGRLPAADGSDESLDGLSALRRRQQAGDVTRLTASPGHRLIFGGDLGRTVDAAVARRFAIDVMPLVLQRYPAATFELLAAGKGFAGVLTGIDNTLVTTPERLRCERPDGVAARILPAVVNGRAAAVAPLDGPGWEALESIEVGSERSTVVAEHCCRALARAVARNDSSSLAREPAEAATGGEVVADSERPAARERFETVSHRWRAEYLSWRQEQAEVYALREAHERSLVKGFGPFVVSAWCCACRCQAPMHVDFEFGGDPRAARPNWRERLVCQRCGLNNKLRGLLHILEAVIAPAADPRVLVWELESELTAALEERFDDVTGVVGGVGLPQVAAAAEAGAGAAGEESRLPRFDCLLAVDMFERAEDFKLAVDRSFELLAAGGGMVFTAAFRSDRERSRVLNHQQSGQPSQEFGWAMLQSFRDSGFEDVVGHFFWSPTFGYLGTEQVVFVARKGSGEAC